MKSTRRTTKSMMLKAIDKKDKNQVKAVIYHSMIDQCEKNWRNQVYPRIKKTLRILNHRNISWYDLRMIWTSHVKNKQITSIGR